MGAPTAASTRGGKLLAGFESRMIWVDSSTTKYLYFVLAMCSARMELYIHLLLDRDFLFDGIFVHFLL